MRRPKRFLLAVFGFGCILLGGCGGRADEATLAIATDIPAANIEIEAAQRTNVIERVGRPDSGFPTAAAIRQIYVVSERDLDDALDELRVAVETDGWVMKTVYEEGVWITTTRTFGGRQFYLQTGYSPPKDGEHNVSLILKECGRGNSPCAENLP